MTFRSWDTALRLWGNQRRPELPTALGSSTGAASWVGADIANTTVMRSL
jgi:hypothetical protein